MVAPKDQFSIMKGKPKVYSVTKHKSEGMVDVKNRRCSFNGCSKRPDFNYEGETKGLFI